MTKKLLKKTATHRSHLSLADAPQEQHAQDTQAHLHTRTHSKSESNPARQREEKKFLWGSFFFLQLHQLCAAEPSSFRVRVRLVALGALLCQFGLDPLQAELAPNAFKRYLFLSSSWIFPDDLLRCWTGRFFPRWTTRLDFGGSHLQGGFLRLRLYVWLVNMTFRTLLEYISLGAFDWKFAFSACK